MKTFKGFQEGISNVSLFSTILKELYINFVSEIENHLPSTILEIIERSGKFTRENIYILLHKVHQSQPFYPQSCIFPESWLFYIFSGKLTAFEHNYRLYLFQHRSTIHVAILEKKIPLFLFSLL